MLGPIEMLHHAGEVIPLHDGIRHLKVVLATPAVIIAVTAPEEPEPAKLLAWHVGDTCWMWPSHTEQALLAVEIERLRDALASATEAAITAAGPTRVDLPALATDGATREYPGGPLTLSVRLIRDPDAGDGAPDGADDE